MHRDDPRSSAALGRQCGLHVERIGRRSPRSLALSTCARSCRFLPLRRRPDRMVSERTGYSRPLPNIPSLYRTAGDVRIVPGKVLGNLTRISLEQEHGAIYRVGQCSAQQKFAPVARLPRFFKVLVAKSRSPRNVIIYNFIEQEVMFRHFLALLDTDDNYRAARQHEWFQIASTQRWGSASHAVIILSSRSRTAGPTFLSSMGGSSSVRSLYRIRRTWETVAAVPVPKHSLRLPASYSVNKSPIEIRSCLTGQPMSPSRVITLSRVTPGRIVPLSGGVMTSSPVTKKTFITPHSSTKRCSIASSHITEPYPASRAS